MSNIILFFFLFTGFQEDVVHENETRNCSRSFVAVFHSDADRLFLSTQVASVAKLDRQRFRDRALAQEADVQEGFRVSQKEKNDSDAEVTLSK